MAAETLNFGPEWLRALSGGSSVVSPPPSPAMPKYKLAEFRYGREEMLALYIREHKVPEELQDKEFSAVLQEEPLQPLALEPLTEEEQRNFSLSVNSVAVLRLMGKGAPPPLGGASRGRGSTRSRGRGRGDSGFYQRSIEEAEGVFGRNPREIQRSQSWDDRGDRRFEKPARREGARSGFEEGGAAPRKEHARSDSENWRSLREDQDEDEGSWRLGAPRRDGDRWRSASPDGGPRSAGWREHSDRRRKFDLEPRGERGGCTEEEGRGGAGGAHPRRGMDDDKDGLPEWCLDDEDEEMGTFDASGAFLPLKKGPKEPIPEEQELDFRVLQEEEEDPADSLDETGPEAGSPELPPLPPEEEKAASPAPLPTLGPLWSADVDGGEGPAMEKDLPAAKGTPSLPGDDLRGPQLSPGPSSPPTPPGDLEDDEGLKHLQQEAEKLVASLQDSSLEEEQFTAAMQAQGLRHSAAATALPLNHGAARRWFYKDPQGEIQGPFTTQEMAEWFQAGYFSMTLLVKRGCDEGFQPLGEVIKMWGRVPFAPGPSPPPLLGNLDQGRLKKQQELAAAALYQQLQHQQFLQLISSRQPPQCALREKAALGDLSPPPQQQQQQQQLSAFLQQLQALKPSRGGDQNLLPAMTRSLSVPDSSPLWDIYTSASPQSGGEASLWDVPVNSSTQGPILEQLQMQHKERREVELRAKREEEERKRREEKRRQQQEEQKRRQEEEELFRRKQVRQQELLLKLLQQQQQASATPTPPTPSSLPPLWAGLTKQGLSMKTLLELQLEGERQLHKPPREVRAQALNHRTTLGGLGAAPLNQWAAEAGPLWGSTDKSTGGLGLWEDALKGSGLARGLGLKNSRSSPSLSDSYSHLSARPRKKTEEEEKLLKLLQGIPRPQDGFTQWCEQMLHTLSAAGSLDVPMAVAILKEVESPYDVHDYIRSCLGDTLEAKEFAKQFLERRAKQKASQQRQQQQEAWLSSGSLQTAFQTNHSTKLGPGEGSKAKRRALMLHSDPSILGYSLHGPTGEIESVEDY
ncbi:GRB10-interacting GYF protein 1 isoform X2 [Erinaceus europaeus]|uniref:GRB10-interacting GYF protein 1 isoform X2 n=1 Tax=Erinaceus europaeus TaxID=9365 RepID=A0ABM3VYU0_ERIEU|nr:GRB10-interacting GYF protein 1 isoform X2 [Erinaceus europaeus]